EAVLAVLERAREAKLKRRDGKYTEALAIRNAIFFLRADVNAAYRKHGSIQAAIEAIKGKGDGHS
ncbi:MAG: hypothetical protein AAGI67_09510, partial [Pseudomonadota bacterium]